MLIYYSMVLVAAAAAWLNSRSRSLLPDGAVPVRRPVAFVPAFLVWGYVVFWVAMRSRFVDTAAYIAAFQLTDASWQGLMQALGQGGKCPGWGIFQVLFKSLISSNYHVFFLAIALIQAVPVMNTLRKYSENYFWGVLLFILSLNFTWMMNGVRQFVAVAILFGCTPLILERKWLRYAAVVLLMSTVHFTAVIMLPIYWCVTSRPWHRRMLLAIAGVMLVALFTAHFTAGLEEVLSHTAYANATAQFAEDDGVHPLRVLMYCVPVLLSFIFRKQLEEADDPVINLSINMSVITCGLYIVGMLTSGILIGRLPIYCSMYNYILYPYMFNHCFKRFRWPMYACCTVSYLIFFLIMSRGFYYYSDIMGFFG